MNITISSEELERLLRETMKTGMRRGVQLAANFIDYITEQPEMVPLSRMSVETVLESLSRRIVDLHIPDPDIELVPEFWKSGTGKDAPS